MKTAAKTIALGERKKESSVRNIDKIPRIQRADVKSNKTIPVGLMRTEISDRTKASNKYRIRFDFCFRTIDLEMKNNVPLNTRTKSDSDCVMETHWMYSHDVARHVATIKTETRVPITVAMIFIM